MSRTPAAGLSGRQYRWLDRVTKLLGIGLIAGGLELGGGTPIGMLLAVAGVLIGVSTVVITTP
ncbi:hypothetical protein [Halorubrum salsamenti]|uniref:hypothetical protein n=1 Tax=Halorubrum salsamenti TaxID=2583990 RepID=UPI00119FB946|nr:hypothetical protein [Halorubrum salsamenti]